MANELAYLIPDPVADRLDIATFLKNLGVRSLAHAEMDDLLLGLIRIREAENAALQARVDALESRLAYVAGIVAELRGGEHL